MVFAERLSAYIIRLRKSKGISETQMAEKLGIKRSTYHYRERNLFKNIDESEALKLPLDTFFADICRALKADPKEVIRLVSNGEEPQETIKYAKSEDVAALVDVLLKGIKEIRQNEISQIEALSREGVSEPDFYGTISLSAVLKYSQIRQDLLRFVPCRYKNRHRKNSAT